MWNDMVRSSDVHDPIAVPASKLPEMLMKGHCPNVYFGKISLTAKWVCKLFRSDVARSGLINEEAYVRPMRTAVIYSSKTGNTKAAAEYIAGRIGAEAIDVRSAPDVSSYDRIILGMGIYAGRPSKAMSEFIESNKDSLKGASMFVTCLYNEEKGAKQLQKIAEGFGIADAIFFNKVKKQFGAEDSKLEEYIRTL